MTSTTAITYTRYDTSIFRTETKPLLTVCSRPEDARRLRW